MGHYNAGENKKQELFAVEMGCGGLPPHPLAALAARIFFPYKMEIIPAASSEWIVRLYPDIRRAGDIALAGTGAEAIPPHRLH